MRTVKREIRDLKENEYYIIEDLRREVNYTAFSFQALEHKLNELYDEMERWAILTNSHKLAKVFIKELGGGKSE